MYQLNEIFYSIQGEGRLTGFPSVFVRFSGCNLSCRWCDTAYACSTSEGSKKISRQDLVGIITKYSTNYIVLTGGEPMLQKNLSRLVCDLREIGKHITIETNGTIVNKALTRQLPLANYLFSVSPKLRNSTPQKDMKNQEKKRLNFEALHDLINSGNYQIKFPVADIHDIAEVEEIVDMLEIVEPERVMLMPIGTDAETLSLRLRWMIPEALRRGWSVTQRLHIQVYGNRRGV